MGEDDIGKGRGVAWSRRVTLSMARRPPSFLSRPHCSPKLQYDLKPQHVNASTRITLDQRTLKNWISKHGPDSTPMTDNRPITDRFSVRSASPAPAVSDEPVHRIFMSKPRHVPALFPASGQQHIVPAPPKLTFPGFKGNWALHGGHMSAVLTPRPRGLTMQMVF